MQHIDILGAIFFAKKFLYFSNTTYMITNTNDDSIEWYVYATLSPNKYMYNNLEITF